MNLRPLVASGLIVTALLSGCATREVSKRGHANPVEQSAVKVAPAADVVALKSCQELKGNIVSETEHVVVLKQGENVQRLLRNDIAFIRRGNEGAPGAAPVQTSLDRRLLGFEQLIETALKHPWAKDLHQVPATVIDKGVLRNVPYLSYRAAQFEINIYGDPDHPAGMEVGVYGGKVASKREIRDVMTEFLLHAEDKEVVRQLSLAQDKREREGMTFEVTPPTAADSYGGWWISFYDACAFERARASENELKEISEEASEHETVAAHAAEKSSAVTHPAKQASAPAPTSVHQGGEVGWSGSRGLSTSSHRSSSGSKRVYVRGYFKKNGTYVRSHSRSRRR